MARGKTRKQRGGLGLSSFLNSKPKNRGLTVRKIGGPNNFIVSGVNPARKPSQSAPSPPIQRISRPILPSRPKSAPTSNQKGPQNPLFSRTTFKPNSSEEELNAEELNEVNVAKVETGQFQPYTASHGSPIKGMQPVSKSSLVANIGKYYQNIKSKTGTKGSLNRQPVTIKKLNLNLPGHTIKEGQFTTEHSPEVVPGWPGKTNIPSVAFAQEVLARRNGSNILRSPSNSNEPGGSGISRNPTAFAPVRPRSRGGNNTRRQNRRGLGSGFKVSWTRHACRRMPKTAKDKAAYKKWLAGRSIGFTERSHLKALGVIPRANGTCKVSPKYR